MTNDEMLIVAESKESADAIYKRNNTVLADMVAHINKKNSKVEYICKHSDVVSFRFDTASFDLVYPNAFLQCKEASLKRLFLYMMGDYHNREYNNQQAVRTTAVWIEAFKLMKKEIWRHRSKIYTDEWRDETQYQPSMRPAIKATNKKLVSALKKAKADFEKAERLEQHFNELRKKYL